METPTQKIKTSAELISVLSTKVLALNSVVRACHVTSQLISITEMYCICLLFEAPRKRNELYALLVRDPSTKVHALQRLKEKELIEFMPDTTVKLTEKGTVLYYEFIENIR